LSFCFILVKKQPYRHGDVSFLLLLAPGVFCSGVLKGGNPAKCRPNNKTFIQFSLACGPGFSDGDRNSTWYLSCLHYALPRLEKIALPEQ